MRERLVIPVLLAVLTLGFTACQKDKSGDSALSGSKLGIQIQALNKSYSLPVSSAGLKSAEIATTKIMWDTAKMVVSSVKFEAELKSMVSHRDSVEISYKLNGPQYVDLFDTDLSLGNFILQPGFYDQIELKVEGLKKDAGTGPVFYLHGTYTDVAAIEYPVRVIITENVLFKTEKDSVDITAADPIFSSIIQLYLDQLMLNVPVNTFDNAEIKDGVILISANSNKEIYRILMYNLVKNHHCEHRKGHWKGH